MQLSQLVKKRYTTKAFDPTRKLSDAQVTELKTLLQYAPSSTNSQPWHFIIASSAEGKARVAKATDPAYAYNSPKILNASHVVVLCTRVGLDDNHLEQVTAQEDRDGRFASAEARQGAHNARHFYANLHHFERRDTQHWMEKQVYIALGTLLLGASVLDIDATPIEGFDPAILSQELDLRAQHLMPSVIVALGYHAESDFNKALPKSRLAQAQVISEI